MKAVILAAGYATRLYPLTLNTPKCLLKVGDQTILDALCRKLEAVSKIDEVLIVTNAKFFEQLNTWKDKTSFRFPVRILNDGTTSNETRLGAIGDFDFLIKKCGISADVIMLASDNLFESDLAGFLNFCETKKDSISVGLYDIQDPRLASKKFGVLEIDSESRVVGMEEKPEHPRSSLIGMGIYFFPQSTLKYVPEYLAQKEAKDAPGYYLQWLYPRVKIFGFLFKGLWYDIGDLNALEEAKKIFGGESK